MAANITNGTYRTILGDTAKCWNVNVSGPGFQFTARFQGGGLNGTPLSASALAESATRGSQVCNIATRPRLPWFSLLGQPVVCILNLELYRDTAIRHSYMYSLPSRTCSEILNRLIRSAVHDDRHCYGQTVKVLTLDISGIGLASVISDYNDRELGQHNFRRLLQSLACAMLAQGLSALAARLAWRRLA